MVARINGTAHAHRMAGHACLGAQHLLIVATTLGGVARREVTARSVLVICATCWTTFNEAAVKGTTRSS